MTFGLHVNTQLVLIFRDGGTYPIRHTLLTVLFICLVCPNACCSGAPLAFLGGTASPAPSVGTTAPSPGSLGFAERVARTQSFQDRSLSTGGSNGVAVAALGLLGVLTFLPVCSK